MAVEEKAIKLLEAEVPDKDKSQPGYERFRQRLEEKLETFRKAAAEKGARIEKP